ncbi:phenylalanine--tRNA ligase subunit beta [Hydrogenophaga soli]
MQFPESWLRTFCNPPLSTQQLADTLTMAGLEVEELVPAAPSFTGIVVGEILSAEQHPNADRLRVCRVNVGAIEPLQIVCGAPNARAGIRVPCALVGAELPSGADGQPFRIKLGKLRGVDSHGMLCSASELGLSEDQGGLLELATDAVIGQDIRQHLMLDDVLFTLKLTPNLAHCLSVFGVARELSALTGAPLNSLEFTTVPPLHDQRLDVSVKAPDLCGRFSGRVIRGINPKAATPAWMVQRLARCGQRSVSALVDISNYVMFELGRPTHIFDLDRIQGGLEVRWAREGESLKLLNGNTVQLDEHVGVIADAQQVESLAGIMGGDSTAVSDDTRNVYVEAAFWWPKAIVGRSRRFNFSTDAGHRFERGVDPQGTVEHIERITQLILDICGGEPGPVDDQQPCMPERKAVTLRVDRACKVIGMSLSQSVCAAALRGLGLDVTEGAGVLTVQPPSYRFDLQIEEDLIEEVARVVGYDNLPTTAPKAPISARMQKECRRSPHTIRRTLADLGYQETINFSFVDERWETELHGNASPIRLLNPIASQMSVMRSSLLGSLLQVAKFNLDRKADRVCVFEVGRVFSKDASIVDSDTTVAGFSQPMNVAGLVYGTAQALNWEGDRRLHDFFDVKGHVEKLFSPVPVDFAAAVHPTFHPGRCAKVIRDGVVVGHVGELHPKWRQSLGFPQAPILFELNLDAVIERPVAVFHPYSKFQAVERDVAVWVSESVTHDQLMAAVYSAPLQGLLQSATLFDIYRPKVEALSSIQSSDKSMALRLVFNREDSGLTDVEIDAAMTQLIAHLGQQVDARIRA